jgi:hypothetical protein
MDIILEMIGCDFDVENALRDSSFRECADSWRLGEMFGAGLNRTFQHSGFSVCFGRDDGCELEVQVADALEFLQKESNEIRRLRALPGIEKARLRFGEIWTEGIVGRSSRLPSQLLLACGQLGLDIVLSQYLGTDDYRKAPNQSQEPSAVCATGSATRSTPAVGGG